MHSTSWKRRDFLKTTGLGAAGLAFAGRVGAAPIRTGTLLSSDQPLRVACVGVGGKGKGDVRAVSGEKLVAFCDVDTRRAASTFEAFPDVPRYSDYRVMLHELDDHIDAVTVSTPDHMHFPIALAAIELGKHVYVQKPLTHTIWEARELAVAARRHRVITQMGNQGHAGEGIRLVKEWIDADAIGPVREVHVWTDRPIWPQGGGRPAQGEEVPEGLDWNLWLGTAPHRPYHSAYVPFAWRGWWDFGCGALGDMGCHLLDASHYALELGAPEWVEAESGPVNLETAPAWSIVTYQFPARGDKPPVTLTWYDGGKRPPRLDPDSELSRGGQYFVGDRGVLLDKSDYCTSPRLVPETAMQEFMRTRRPEKTIPRVKNSYREWIEACKGGPLPGSNFDVSGALTENVLLGNLAIRTGKRIQWDALALRCPNAPEADALIRNPQRAF